MYIFHFYTLPFRELVNILLKIVNASSVYFSISLKLAGIWQFCVEKKLIYSLTEFSSHKIHFKDCNSSLCIRKVSANCMCKRIW